MDPLDDGRGGRPDGPDSQRDPQPHLGHIVDGVTRKLVTALILSSGIIGLAIYSQPSPPHYQLAVAPDGRVMRLNTSTGTLVACTAGQCTSIIRTGTHFGREERPALPPAPAAAPPAAPAPAQAPAAQPAAGQPRQ